MKLRFSIFLTAFAFAAAPAFAQDCANIPTSMGQVDMAYAHCASPMAPEASAGPSDDAFGYNNAALFFQTFVQDTPGILTDVGPTYDEPAGGFLNAGDFEGDDFSTWYTVDNNGNAVSVNTTTGVTTSLGVIAAPTGGFSGLTWDYTTSQFFAVSGTCNTADQALSIIDFDALTATPVGTDATSTCLVDIAADPLSGDLYVLDLVSNELMSMDKGTGQTTAIGDLGYDPNFGQGMDFDNDDGQLYLYAFNNVTFLAELRIADTSTGNSTLVGTLGVDLQQFGAASSATLVVPVELTGFNATVNGTNVLLAWETASETNNAGFEVQVQAGDSWNTLGWVEGHGTTTEAQSYSYSTDLGIGTHVFRLKQIDFDGQFEYHGNVEVTVGTPGTHVLSSAYPNPFNPSSQFELAVAQEQHVTAALYNALGQRVATLFSGTVDANQSQQITIDGANLASGLYVVRVNGENFADALRVTLLK